MKTYFWWFLSITFLATSCKEEEDVYQPFFDFDTVDYYSTSISEDILLDDSRTADLTTYLVLGDTLNSFRDTILLNTIHTTSFEQVLLDSASYSQLSHIFSGKEKDGEAFFDSCIPFYRDLLVFRKDGAISGIAKLCFSCGQSHFIGASHNTSTFGNRGEWKMLEKVLRKESIATDEM